MQNKKCSNYKPTPQSGVHCPVSPHHKTKSSTILNNQNRVKNNFVHHIMRKGTLAIFLATNLLVGGKIIAQETSLKKEVMVVRPYEPSISDAFKINQPPRIEDTIRVKPNFTYSIVQRPAVAAFTPNPISAARMMAEPLKDLSNGYLKLGMGNATLPVAEAYFMSKRNPDFMYGAWVQYRSKIGKVKLENSKKVDASSSTANLQIFGKRMFVNKILQGDLSYNNTTKTYYGYNILDSLISPTSEKQKVNRINANLNFNTSRKDSAHFNYNALASFEHLGDKFDMQENRITASGGLNKYLKQEQLGVDISFTHYSRSSQLDMQNNSILNISPWIHFFGKQWRAVAGLYMVYDANSGINNTYIYPRAFLSYDVVSHYVIPFIEFGGYLEENSYSKLIQENPWVTPGLSGWNTTHKLAMTGGVKGKFSARVSYNVQASYSIIDSLYFFTNTSINPANPLYNRFNLDFDNVELTKILGELTIAPSERFSLLLHTEYFNYKMNKLAHPWHKPDYNAYAELRYNLREKIYTNLQLFAVGKRWALSPDGVSPVRLNGYVDANLGFDYNFNNRLYAFLNLNNIASSHHQEWYLYPVQGFNVQLGLSYKF
jgi:hypothetical protein